MARLASRWAMGGSAESTQAWQRFILWLAMLNIVEYNVQHADRDRFEQISIEMRSMDLVAAIGTGAHVQLVDTTKSRLPHHRVLPWGWKRSKWTKGVVGLHSWQGTEFASTFCAHYVLLLIARLDARLCL